MKRFLYTALFSLLLATLPASAFSSGPRVRFTGAPGDNPLACTQCHTGTLNSFGGSVRVVYPGGTQYTPGKTYRLKVEIRDPEQQRWGFELSARLTSDLTNGQAGDLTSVDGNTRVLCDGSAAGTPKPCSPDKPVQFAEHVAAGTRPGTPNGVDFELDWTAPAAGSGAVTFYVAGNAANNNGNNQGDHIYTSSLSITEATGGGLQVPATAYDVRHLTSDLTGGWGEHVDPNLAGSWGIALGPTTPFWISNEMTGTTTVYNGNGEPFPTASPLIVKIPNGAGGNGHSSPTGQVWNGTAGFEVGPGKPAAFLFATENGGIAGWNRDVDPANAILKVDNAGANYKGLALGIGSSGPMLYAANFKTGTVDVFDYTFQSVPAPGGFTDPTLPAGYAPFNIQRFGRRLFVSYAKQDESKDEDEPGDGNGLISVFDMDGNFQQRLVTGGVLNSPWGMAIAPAFFGDYSNTLLVGNFGDGKINAFDLTSGQPVGQLRYRDGSVIALEGLWALVFGNGRNGGDANTLYFTAAVSGGPSGSKGDHGVFGSVTVLP
ncbi:TIGR03118 family protein [uncultured Paludibaculum sp.]|uniref:TIGR03118 family protein n=1 Tax=uncultured Paludibaculum sp. TaxID=1765020 RepID=UPI002AABD772|nr:TIGR03118 family protein [uncultured Paludibaculum sp.]